MIESPDGLFIAMKFRECDTLVIISVYVIGINLQGICEYLDCILEPFEFEEGNSLVIE